MVVSIDEMTVKGTTGIQGKHPYSGVELEKNNNVKKMQSWGRGMSNSEISVQFCHKPKLALQNRVLLIKERQNS